ncbi:MAG: glutamate---cysteine ligase / carboxylate-amine ligase [Solirubrobacteraceae bacterium]|jgi:carboxylate-amine ligase|nr:glutamate---cysteine ligase / carboxylate-amine ligase [Solirubrobacteraceae bacterium]
MPEAFSLGIEEELFLVDPDDGEQRDAREAVLDGVREPRRGEVTGEVHACEVEIITDVCRTPADAIAVLRDLRRAVLDTGIGIMGTGTHPTAPEGSSEVSDTERYDFIASQLGDAAVSPVAAMHVHVGMPDAETAIRVFNGLRRHLPLLEALAANSPFRHGRDSGFASARELSLRAWPRSGAPRAFDDNADFVTYAERLTRAADVPDYTFHWWKLRPHPRLGTVEVRALDVQDDLAHAAALAALVQSLALYESRSPPAPAIPPEILEEASYRAGREGLAATLPDSDGVLHPVSELAQEAMEIARPAAETLGCAAELEGITALIAAGGGAGRQRHDAESGGLTAVLSGLLRRSGG